MYNCSYFNIAYNRGLIKKKSDNKKNSKTHWYNLKLKKKE